MDKYQLAHRLYRPLGWVLLQGDSPLRRMTVAELRSEKERRRVHTRSDLAVLGYTPTEVCGIQGGGEGAMVSIDLRRRSALGDQDGITDRG